MAILLTKKPTNLTVYPNSFERQEPTPLDANSLFFKLEDAQNYAKEGTVAYVGQIITVVQDSSVNVYVIANTQGDLINLISKESTGTRTFETYSAMEQALPTLSRGQIVTLVNSTTTEAYIVNYNCTRLVKIEGNAEELSELDTETILDIFDGTFVPDEVWPSNAIQQNAIDEILNGSFEESEIPSNGIQKDTIDSILNGGYEA